MAILITGSGGTTAGRERAVFNRERAVRNQISDPLARRRHDARVRREAAQRLNDRSNRAQRRYDNQQRRLAVVNRRNPRARQNRA